MWRFLFSKYNFLVSNLSMKTTGPFGNRLEITGYFSIFQRPASFAVATESLMYWRARYCFVAMRGGPPSIPALLGCNVLYGMKRTLETDLSLGIQLVYYVLSLMTIYYICFHHFPSSIKIKYFLKWSFLPVNRTSQCNA